MLYLSEVRDFIAGLLTGIVDDENVYSGIMEDKHGNVNRCITIRSVELQSFQQWE